MPLQGGWSSHPKYLKFLSFARTALEPSLKRPQVNSKNPKTTPRHISMNFHSFLELFFKSEIGPVALSIVR